MTSGQILARMCAVTVLILLMLIASAPYIPEDWVRVYSFAVFATFVVLVVEIAYGGPIWVEKKVNSILKNKLDAQKLSKFEFQASDFQTSETCWQSHHFDAFFNQSAYLADELFIHLGKCDRCRAILIIEAPESRLDSLAQAAIQDSSKSQFEAVITRVEENYFGKYGIHGISENLTTLSIRLYVDIDKKPEFASVEAEIKQLIDPYNLQIVYEPRMNLEPYRSVKMNLVASEQRYTLTNDDLKKLFAEKLQVKPEQISLSYNEVTTGDERYEMSTEICGIDVIVNLK